MDARIQIDSKLPPEAVSFCQQLLNQNPSERPQAEVLHQRPFLWSERKKIDFLKAVGDQPEAASPTKYPNSRLERNLQMTKTGQNIQRSPWNSHVSDLLAEMTAAHEMKRYRFDKVIDLLRFIRNAYAHKQERQSHLQDELDKNIFLQIYPSLVLDVFGVVHDPGSLDDKNRRNIEEVLNLNEH
jgi:hypothetical protein